MKALLLIIFLLSLTGISQKPEVVISSGHTDQIQTIDISNDGRWLATGSLDKLVKVIDNKTGKELRTFANNAGRIAYVKFDDTGKYLAAFLNSEEIKVWDVATGELIQRFNTRSDLIEFDFVLENTCITYIDEDGNLALMNYKTGETRSVSQAGFVRAKALPDGKFILGYNYKNELFKMDLISGELITTRKVFEDDELVYSPTRMDVTTDGELLAVTFKESEIHIINTSNLETTTILKGHDARVKDIKFAEDSHTLYSLQHNNESLYEWDVDKSKLKKKEPVAGWFSSYIETHPIQDVIVLADGKSLNYISSKKFRALRRFESKANRILNLAYDQKGKYLAASSLDMKIKLWDLEQNKIISSYHGFWPVAMDPKGEVVVSNMANQLQVMDVVTGEKIGSLPTEFDLIQNIAFSSDGSLIGGVGLNGYVWIWDAKTYKVKHKMKWYPGMTYGVEFGPDGKYMATSNIRNTNDKPELAIWDVEKGEKVTHIEADIFMFSALKFTDDGKRLIASSWDKKIYVFKTSDWSLEKTLEGHVNTIHTIDISPDGKYLASGAGNNTVWAPDNSVYVWDIESGEIVCKYNGHIGTINKLIFDKTSHLVYSCGDDGTIKAWDYRTCEEVGTYVSVLETDYVVVTPDYYYMASRDALEAVSFRIKDKLFPFDQFDLKLNRPDIVSSRLGKTPEGLINAYEYVYKKRLRRMNFNEEDLGDDFHVPELKITTENISLITTEPNLKFSVAAEDSKYKLDRLIIYVNDVPLNGSEGISLKKYNSESITYELDVPLISGQNRIQVSALNEKGVESLRQTVNILRDEAPKGDLYVVTISVGTYKDGRFNLKYPVKDATDIQEALSKTQALYENVHSLSLSDSLVVLENLERVKKFVAKASPDDVVVMFVAGHGVLDESFNYYFGAYDIDFDNPSKRGIPYEELDALLLSTKAIKKLLIMDTCHSGEVDEEEIETTESEVEIEDVEFRAAGQGVRKKEAFGLQNSMELMENMFADVRKGSGAHVISSAGGAEYAMESDKWQNGLFTYCLLTGLTEQKADKNHNGSIHISELKKYVYSEVMKLSEGRQRPTSREENTVLDYRIW